MERSQLSLHKTPLRRKLYDPVEKKRVVELKKLYNALAKTELDTLGTFRKLEFVLSKAELTKLERRKLLNDFKSLRKNRDSLKETMTKIDKELHGRFSEE